MEDAVRIAADWLTYLANGLLVLGYFVVERLAYLIALSTAMIVVGTFDRLVQNQAVYAPSRYESGAVQPTRVPRTAQAITGLAIGLWLAATWSFQSLVPAIGAAMWVASLGALL